MTSAMTSEAVTVFDLIEKAFEAAWAIHNASPEHRAELHPDLVAKADEIVEMLDISDAA